MINEFTQEFIFTETTDERIESIIKEFELSIHWNRPIILFAVFGSEYVRRDMHSELENRLFDIGQYAVHIKMSEHPTQSLSRVIDEYEDVDRSVFIISYGNLGAHAQNRYFETLNDQSDYFFKRNIKALFWLTQSEIISLARMAPEFWSNRHRVIEFTESPKTDHMLKRTLESIWQGTGEYDDQIEDTDEKISFRETLLTNLPESTESNSIRANMLLTLGVLQWRKGDFEKAENLLYEALNLAVKVDNKWLEAECLNACALVFSSTGRVDRAIDAYKQAIRLLPDQIFAWNNLGNLCAKIGRNDEAIVTFSKAIECNPEDSVAWNGLGHVYKKIGYYDDAINAYRKSVQFTPSFAQPWNGLGDVYKLTGRVDDAIKAYEQSIKINENYLEPLIGLGKLYLEAGKHREAIKVFRKALIADEKNKDTWNDLGVAQLGCNDFAAAENSFLNSIRVDRTFGTSYNNLGIVYTLQKKYEKSIDAFQKALEFLHDEDERAQTWNRLGDAFRSINNYEKAMQAYKNADKQPVPIQNAGALRVMETQDEETLPITTNPIISESVLDDQDKVQLNSSENQLQQLLSPKNDTSDKYINPPVWLMEHSIDTETRDESKNIFGNGDEMADYPFNTDTLAFEQPEKSGEEFSSKTDAVAWNEIGNEYFRSNNYAEAIIAYNKALQKDPNFGMPYANMGLISVIQERYSEAILLYEKSIKLLADNEEKAIAYNGLGNAFRAVGDYDSAIKSFRKAAELDPYSAGLQNQTNVFKSEASVKSPTFWADLGTAFLDNCSFNEAITALNKAIELNSNDGQVLFKLGKAYSYSGRYKEAILAFSNSVELLQDDKEKANSLNHLGNAYRKLNDYDKAIESFRKAVVLSDEGVTLATRARFSLLSNCRAEKV